MTPSESNYNSTSADGRPPFSWSLRRRKLFEFCRLAYYFHYYGAAGGWDKHASDRCRLIYRLKYLRDVEDWLGSILSRTIAQVFIRRRPQTRNNLLFMASALRRECFALFHRELDDARNESWKEDPKTLNLNELYYATTSNSAVRVFEYSKLRLEQLLQGFVRHPLAAELSDIDSALFRHFECPTHVELAGYTVWFAPVLIWQNAGILRILTWLSAENHLPEELAFNTTLSHLLGRNEYIFPAEAIRSEFYYPGRINCQPELFCPQPLSTEECERLVMNSASLMLEKLFSDGSAMENDFPGWSQVNAAACSRCRFRQLCR